MDILLQSCVGHIIDMLQHHIPLQISMRLVGFGSGLDDGGCAKQFSKSLPTSDPYAQLIVTPALQWIQTRKQPATV